MLSGSKVARIVYDSQCLRSLRSTASVSLSAEAADLVRRLGIGRRRGCRAGHAVQARRLTPSRLLPVGNGAYVVTGNRRASPRPRRPRGSSPSCISIRTPRQDTTTSRPMTFASLNVRSLSSTKLDGLLVEFQQRSVDVLLLCETWHDADSVSIRRLRTDGFNVVERARRRDCSQTSLSVNHGGVAVVTVAAVSLTAVDVGVQPSTFECVAARVTSGTSSCIVVLLYRPGSCAVTATFLPNCRTFWIDCRLSTYVDPVVLAGDVNIRLERTADPQTVEFSDTTQRFP